MKNYLSRTQKLNLPHLASQRVLCPSIVFLRGDKLGLAVRLAQEITAIGRGTDATLRLDGDDEASRLHAQVRIAEGPGNTRQFWLMDLGSTNGTILNGVLLEKYKETLLQDGDKFSVGRHILKFAMLDDLDEEYHQRVHELIMHDDLTGLLTRKSFGIELERELARSMRHNHQFCILMMDIDFFKKVNDTFGHLVGSQVLAEVSLVIKGTLRDSDIAGRYGGEEYIALLPETNKIRGVEAAERIRQAIDRQPFTASVHDANAKNHITISIGVASYPYDGTTATDLIDNADLALYHAKQQGRNKVIGYNPNITHIPLKA
ncbi:MAG: GGDEF domain-containing protein [Blastocatellia bacterium]|nr:GGDEF domain-containing protein [Blastocatellia bacterium]